MILLIKYSTSTNQRCYMRWSGLLMQHLSVVAGNIFDGVISVTVVISCSMLLSHFDQSLAVGGYNRCCDICLKK